MEMPILVDVAIIFALAIPIIFLCGKIHVSSLVALLLTGILAGPEGAGLISSHEKVEHLAEIGVILLLFTIGIEFSLKELWKMKFMVLVGGSLQLVITAAGAALLMWSFHYPVKVAIFFGCLIAPSSTAIVLKMLQEKARISTAHGKTSLAILIYQDIAVVPIMLLLPILAGSSGNLGYELLLLVLKGGGLIILTLVSAIWIVPKFLERIVKTRNQELFLLCVVTIAVSTALLTARLGISLELGAFLAGLVISESRYSYQALAGILPFRQAFLPFFFISVGMLLNIHFFLGNIGVIVLLTVGVLLWKFLVVTITALTLRISLYEAILAGITIAQVGEFSFILASAGTTAGLSLENIYQPFLAVSILTMALTPFLIAAGPKLAETVAKVSRLGRWFKKEREIDIADGHLQDHIVIVGYGINGRNIAHAARVGKIPYVIVELNPVTVQEQSAKGEPIYYGDAVHASILEHVKIDRARVLVVSISDSLATRKIVSVARSLNRNVCIIARTRFVAEMKPLHRYGADEVIPEEFETSIEIFTRVLKKYLISENKITELTEQIRSHNYRVFRNPKKAMTEWDDIKINIPEVSISTFQIAKDNTNLVDKELAILNLKREYGVTILAIRRNGKVIVDIHGDTKLLAEDALITLGTTEKLTNFGIFLQQSCQSGQSV